MKKIAFLAVAATAVVLASCNQAGKAQIKDNVDSLTYELGVAQADGLKQYMAMQLGVDSTQLDEFIKGMKVGALEKPDAKQNAYNKGVEVGHQIEQMAKGLSGEVYANDSTKQVNVNNLLAGIIDGLKGTAGETADEAMKNFQDKLAPIRTSNLEKQYGDNKKKGEEYLAANAKKEGVTTLASGVQYKVLEPGSGDVPSDSAKVNVRYEGKLIDGTTFDSNFDRPDPMVVDMANPRMIPGFTEALKQMPAGAKWEVTIPQEQAYGEQNMGQIKPFSTLIFTIQVEK